MTSLIKFCKPEHNILDRCHALRVGTLEYYRELDPNFAIADATEGVESTVVRSVDTGACTPDAATAVAPFVARPHVQIQNIKLAVTFPNCYIWCCSRLSGPIAGDAGAHFDPDYQSHYTITDPVVFAERVSALLLDQIKRRHFSEPSRERVDGLSVREMGQISLIHFHHDVLYVDQKQSVILDGKVNPYLEGIPAPLRQIFTKPTRYAADREYRFVFWFEHQRYGALPVKRDPVDLALLPISS